MSIIKSEKFMINHQMDIDMASIQITNNNNYQILLIEDSAFDSIIIEQNLLDLTADNEIEKIFNGATAAHHLIDVNNYLTGNSDDYIKCPNIIFLDLDMPKLNGFEVLSVIELSPELWKIPIVITSGVCQDNYVQQNYHNINIIDFIQKPCYQVDLMKALKQAGLY